MGSVADGGNLRGMFSDCRMGATEAELWGVLLIGDANDTYYSAQV